MHSTHALRTFIHEHDDIPAFHAAYLVLTFMAAALFNLGFFALLIAAHMSMDFVKYREVHHFTLMQTIRGIIRESVVDCAFLLLGLVFALYLHHSAGFIALSGLLRSEATILRAAATTIPELSILYHSVNIFTHPRAHMRLVDPALRHVWSPLEGAFMILGALCLLLIVLAPFLLPVSGAVIAKVIVGELLPWRL